MQNETSDLLSDELIHPTIDRKTLIPTWIKIFSWIFLAFGVLALIAVAVGLLGYQFAMALYGFETSDPISTVGLIITLLFLLKGMVAFGILTKKDWAVNLAIADALIGIGICIYSIIVVTAVVRLELLALIPYFYKMWKIRSNWQIGK